MRRYTPRLRRCLTATDSAGNGPARGAQAITRPDKCGQPLEPQECREQLRSQLGEPMDIRRAAALLGCSSWTVRQRLMPMGLPCFQAGPGTKLIFYRKQLIQWIEAHQETRRRDPLLRQFPSRGQLGRD